MVTESARKDRVRLVLPGSADYLRIARVTASAVAARLGYDVDSLDDLRIAVDELAGALTSVAAPEEPIEIEFNVENGALVVEGRAAVHAEPQLDDITQRILRAVGGEYSVDTNAVADDGDGDGGGGSRVGSFRLRLPPPSEEL